MHTLLAQPQTGPQPLNRVYLGLTQVNYLPFTEAFDRAKTENKLVHSILLWGALDDQSC